MENKIERIFELWEKNPGAGGQVLVQKGGKTIFERCYGKANIETDTDITTDTVFHVASVTKQVTVMCIMILQDAGKVNVEDDVRDYVPDLISFREPMKLRYMMNNISGIRDQWELLHHSGRKMEDALVQSDTVGIIATQTRLNFKPQQKYMYSNSNFTLLATIVERVSGMSLPAFAKKYIFDVLGMSSTFIRDDFRMLVPNRASSYHDDGYSYTNGVLTFGVYGSTSLHTTCRDFVKFIAQFKKPTLIKSETMDIMLKTPTLLDGSASNYAGGVKVDSLDGHKYVNHGGANAGFRTFSIIFPDDDLSVVLLSNTYNIPTETAGMDIARAVLGLEARTPNTLDEYRAEAINLDDAVGFYYAPASKSSYEIVKADGALCVNYEDKLVPLKNTDGNLFKMGRRNITFAFGKKCAVNNENNVQPLVKLSDRLDADAAFDYVGEYESYEVNGNYVIDEEDGVLYLYHRRFGKNELHLVEGDTFCYGSFDMNEIVFNRGSGGAVLGFVHNTGRVQGLGFTKTI